MVRQKCQQLREIGMWWDMISMESCSWQWKLIIFWSKISVDPSFSYCHSAFMSSLSVSEGCDVNYSVSQVLKLQARTFIFIFIIIKYIRISGIRKSTFWHFFFEIVRDRSKFTGFLGLFQINDLEVAGVYRASLYWPPRSVVLLYFSVALTQAERGCIISSPR